MLFIKRNLLHVTEIRNLLIGNARCVLMQPLTAWFEKVKELHNSIRLRSLVKFYDNVKPNARLNVWGYPAKYMHHGLTWQKKLSEANFYPDEYEKLMHTKMYLELINTDIWKNPVYEHVVTKSPQMPVGIIFATMAKTLFNGTTYNIYKHCFLFFSLQRM